MSALSLWFSNDSLRNSWGSRAVPDPKEPDNLLPSSGASGAYAYDLAGDPTKILITRFGDTALIAFPGMHNAADVLADTQFATVAVQDGWIP